MTQVASKDEYLKASRALAAGRGSTVDFADPQVGGTAQSENGIGEAFGGMPGQVFSVDQLPDPAIAVAYGMPAVVVPEDLILESPEDAEAHVQGKSADDIANGDLRRSLNDPVLAMDNQVVSAEESIKPLGERKSAAGQVAAGAVEAQDAKDGGDTDETGSGLPVDTEGVQRADSGGTADVSTSNSGSGQGKDDKGKVGGKAK
jgi:hypothetical protein